MDMIDNTDTIGTMPPAGSMEAVLLKVKQTEHERDMALKRYYKSMMGRKDVSLSQWRVCTLAVEYLIRKGYTSITTPAGAKKALIRLGVIKPET